ncbi:uncharacterized protein LOC120558615 [Perca fluviatilis]|uniref:uncharacterized protein LOC120558615 n=1 Tax=Perca fluviatilis TaxID=8168 RepID=UPI0019625DCE|nr:uncharacterized protein LOC120558615 [Perca fluviatilis]XP_039655609.1 uncharacterized protein LOC120558615 [Perca fluviatilis]XP_039655610.1 uncharacterized protein LOC120558615 [Perca fluviatilis]XP_039655611.1 uncharacterized protein LOC120558615 [Perca fluviatilis]
MAENTNTTFKYDNIPCIFEIPGPPTRKQLKPKKEKIGTLTTMTLGEKNPNKINKTILLVGETGAGKSTLINALVNYAMGVEWEDDVWFQIVEEEKKSKSQSQTSDVIVYQIFGFEDKPLPYSLTIIDTPGYGSTAGIKEDVIISQRLFDLFRSDDGVHEINAVGLVLKATDNRLSDRMRYIFDSVMSLFGNDMETKIVALITHSNGLTPDVLQELVDAKIKCAKDKENETVHFMFDNCQSKQKTKKQLFALKNAWGLTMNGMAQFTDYLNAASPQKLLTTVEVMKARIRLAACVQNLQERIALTEHKQREIQQTKELLKLHEQQMKDNEKFTVEVDEVYKDKEPILGGTWWLVFFEGAVCCKVCEENCHYPGCTMAQKPGHCEVMKDGRCTSCTRKCPASDHVKENWKYVSKTRKVPKTLKDVKEKYEKGRADCEKTTSLLETLEKHMDELQKEKDQLIEESFQHVVQLKQIALNVNSLSTHVHLDVLIKKMEEKGDTEKKKKLEEMQSQIGIDDEIKVALFYMFGKLTGAVKALRKYM